MSKTRSSHSQGKNLPEWLSYLESIHSVEIDLGLSRIAQVAKRLNVDFGFAKVITVAGTNGKGTTCAFLENALLAESSSVAVYSSPHIECFNERLRVNKQDVDDVCFINAFEQIESARGEISLTYYEYTTLAAFLVLMKRQPDYIILEVGLGGRLDATNIIDADIAVITTIDLDHQAFLGDTREAIGYEKAGIMRANRLAIIGDEQAPESVIKYGNNLGAMLKVREQDFVVSDLQSENQNLWQWHYGQHRFSQLRATHIPQANVATALTVLTELDVALNQEKINSLIDVTSVPGRTEFFTKPCHILLDVGHNPQATRYLANNIRLRGFKKIHAVVGMLSDKDIQGSLAPLCDIVSHWYLGGLAVPRGASAEFLAQKLPRSIVAAEPDSNQSIHVNCFDNVSEAFRMACQNATDDELVLVFGSFFTVAEIRRLLLP